MSIRIAYFSAEIGIDAAMPTYCGGLGVLAGDHMRAAAHRNLPICGITLMYREGYYKQVVDEHGNQIEEYPRFDPSTVMIPEKPRVLLKLRGREVHIRAYRLDFRGEHGHVVPIYFLDTDVNENEPDDRIITHRLYSDGQERRMLQEAVLGLGGVKMLDALGMEGIDTYHMNEGHSSFLTLALLERLNGDEDAVRRLCHFTTHTPVPAGHDRFDLDHARSILGSYLPDYLDLPSWRDHHKVHMTELGLHFSRSANGVSELHGQVAREQFPAFDIKAITNGVEHIRWAGQAMQRIFDRIADGWRDDPTLLWSIDHVPDDELLAARDNQKRALLDYVEQSSGIVLNPAVLTIGFARRLVPYKRPCLIFRDLERLKRIAGGRIQLIYSGKSHPTDDRGKSIIRSLHEYARQLAGTVDVVFLANYDMTVARLLTGGADVWLNNPLRPKEASGTSGMKASLNGVPSMSTLDGWWVEGCRDGINGWAFGDPENPDDGADANALYETLEKRVIPAYYDDKSVWARFVRESIKTGAEFSAVGMLDGYVEEAYRVRKPADLPI